MDAIGLQASGIAQLDVQTATFRLQRDIRSWPIDVTAASNPKRGIPDLSPLALPQHIKPQSVLSCALADELLIGVATVVAH